MSRKRRRPDLRATNLVLLGSPVHTATVERALQSLDTRVKHQDWDESVDETVDDGTIAVLLTEAPPTGAMWRSVRTLRQLVPNHVALAVLVRDGTLEREARRLYRAGAAIVLEWPADTKILPRLLVDVLAMRYVHGPATEADKALARVLKALIRTTTPSASGVAVRVRKGVVALSGRVPGLWAARDIERLVAAVAGVGGVTVDALRVDPAGRSDRAIRSTVRRVLGSVTSDTVSAAVRGGRVTLAGSVANRAEARRLETLVSHVQGVRAIDNDLVVSAGAQARDSTIAAKVRKVLAAQFPQLELAVQVFGGHAVVEGEVQTLATRGDVRTSVEDVQGVRNVIDKLQLSSHPARDAHSTWSE